MLLSIDWLNLFTFLTLDAGHKKLRELFCCCLKLKCKKPIQYVA